MSRVRFEARALSVGYGARAVVEGIDFSLREGESLGIVGPNGSGKSTLLKTVLGLLPPLSGELHRAEGLRAGYVPQADSIDPVFPFRARDVVAMAALPEAILPFAAGRERRRLSMEALHRVGIGDLGDRPYRDLSGGQRQRVLLARALATHPGVLALDEPTTGLDLEAETSLLALLRRLREEEGMTVLMASHGLAAVANEATHVILLHGGRHRVGLVADILRAEVLQELFGIPVRVDEVGGRRMISGVPGGTP